MTPIHNTDSRLRVKTGDLTRIEYGIYRLTHHPLQRFEDIIVACLWTGNDSAASHNTALAVYGLADAMPAKIHITVPRPFLGQHPGVVIHHAPLEGDDRTVRDGVPVTTVARTLADMARTSEQETVTLAGEQALSGGLISARRLRELAADDKSLETALPSLGMS